MEFMVVIAIISIMSSVIIVSYTAQKTNRALDFASRQLADDLRVAQSNSVNVLEQSGAVPAGGYGINAAMTAANKYIIFADADENKNYTAAEKIREVALPGGITINDIRKTSPNPPGSVGFVDIVFVPPFGEVSINGAAISSLEIELSNSLGNTKTVLVDDEGKITVQ